MPFRAFTLDEVSVYLHLPRADVEEMVKRRDIPFSLRGGRQVFIRGEIDAWASQRILGLPPRRLTSYHEKSSRSARPILAGNVLLPTLLQPAFIDVALKSKTRSSVIRDLVAFADRTGLVADARELLESVQAREALCSTALPGGLALLHARHHDEHRFLESFLLLGRTIQSVPFGAPDGWPSRIFFLICCQDDRLHLHTLASLCLMAQKTDLLEAPDADAAHATLLASELAVLPPEPGTDGNPGSSPAGR